MPIFTVMAVKVTPRLDQVQPQPPLEEIVVEPQAIVAPDAERAKLQIGKLLPEGIELALVKFAVIPVQLT
jgi:hypothetical protein